MYLYENFKTMNSDNTQDKKNVGRPLEGLNTLSDVCANWYEIILESYKEGGSDAEAMALIYEMRGSFSESLFYRWLKDEEEFSQTIEAGRMLAKAWWVQNGRTNLSTKYFNYQGWFMQMKNRFGWVDKTEQKLDANVTQTTTIINLGNGEIEQPDED